ncbi:MAG: efflux RND transporter periplasmic adaptor subunit [Bacteroidia bacterium]
MYRNRKGNIVGYAFSASLLMLGWFAGGCEAEREKSQMIELKTEAPTGATLPTPAKIADADMHRVAKVARASVIRCTGTIHAPPQSQSTVSVPMGGFVKRIVPLEGQYIKKGATIAVLEHPDYLHLQEQYLSARADLAFLEKENTRQQLLASANAGTGREKEKTESSLQSAKVKVAALAKELAWLRINPDKISPENLRTSIVIPAPVSGYVWNIQANPGKYLDRNAALLEMTDIDHLHLELQVYEQDAPKLKEGQLIKFQIGADAGEQSYEAEVYLIGQLVDPESRSLRIHGHLESENPRFKPGTFVEAEIEAAADSMLFIPREAIRGTESNRFVYVIGEDALQKLPINIKSTDQQGAYLALDGDIDKLQIWLGTEEENGGEHSH